MATDCAFPDVFSWIEKLPPLNQWRTTCVSLCLCSSTSSQPSLNLTISKDNQNHTLYFSIVANFNLPISLWTSKPIKFSSNSTKSLDEETILSLFVNLIEEVLHYGSNNNNSIKFHGVDSIPEAKEVFNLAFLTLFFLICIYEAPADLRSDCLNTLKNNLVNCQSRRASKLLMRLLGSNSEEKWMRSLNLAITNWIDEVQTTRRRSALKTPSPLFSYAISTFGLWKVQLYCPLIAMNLENSSTNSTPLADERLQFSLNYHQVEGAIQFNYRVIPKETWVGIMVNIDNIRCDVIKLVSENLMAERGVGSTEKHFPSRISLQLTPTLQNNILSVSVGKSSENPVREIGVEKSIEAGFEPPNPYLGLKVSAGETMTMSLKPWKFEQSVYGNSGNLNWYLHDTMDGREVFSSKPSKFALINPKAWFKHRYSSVYRPFTRQGGVVFAGDEYGESVMWKVDKSALGRTMEWEVRGWIWLTYWPNRHRTFYNETRRLEFRETVGLTIS
ncbi:neuronal PAS domain protein [Parasponia andersonii]|uniref:Neuronal PAS domain protein n=1 Tax=Parasponia andersonii TaxID=3476 RepID=A0A2P5E0K9_PARAD|nr:neuronal PAS domain protein [Parasponia andersonii]